MAHGSLKWQKMYFLVQARLESLGTTSSNRAPVPAPGDRLMNTEQSGNGAIQGRAKTLDESLSQDKFSHH